MTQPQIKTALKANRALRKQLLAMGMPAPITTASTSTDAAVVEDENRAIRTRLYPDWLKPQMHIKDMLQNAGSIALPADDFWLDGDVIYYDKLTRLIGYPGGGTSLHVVDGAENGIFKRSGNLSVQFVSIQAAGRSGLNPLRIHPDGKVNNVIFRYVTAENVLDACAFLISSVVGLIMEGCQVKGVSGTKPERRRHLQGIYLDNCQNARVYQFKTSGQMVGTALKLTVSSVNADQCVLTCDPNVYEDGELSAGIYCADETSSTTQDTLSNLTMTNSLFDGWHDAGVLLHGKSPANFSDCRFQNTPVAFKQQGYSGVTNDLRASNAFGTGVIAVRSN